MRATAGSDDFDFPVRWRTIKARFSRSVPPAEDRGASLVRKRGAGVWQRRYWEDTIRDDRDYAVHMDYIHFNLVKHGLAVRPADWRFSSFTECVTLGLYPLGLADTGER
jgi:putative transposase